MFLAFEVGNTSVHCAAFDGDTQVTQCRMKTNPSRAPQIYARDVAQALTDAGIRAEDIRGAIVSSVVRQMPDVLSRAVEGQWGISMVVADARMDFGLRIAVPRPEAVGIDRLLIAGETYRLCNGAVVAVGLGTAVTVDLVEADGRFLGGAIAPGLRTSLWALHARTSLLPQVELAMPPGALGQNTSNCIRAGVVYGTAGAVDRLVTEQQALCSTVPQVILTGGDADFLSPSLRTPHQVAHDLALRGLAWVYRHNFKQKNRSRQLENLSIDQ